MRVAYFPNQCAQNSAPVLSALLDSLRSAGHQVEENVMQADAAIIWSVLWSGRMRDNHKVWTHYRHCGKPVIIADIGTLVRGHTWKVALNNITAEGYYGHLTNLDLDRPKKLGIRLKQSSNKTSKIVVAAQHNQSLQVAGLISMEQWIIQQLEQLQTVTDRPVVVRPHPRCKLNFEQIKSRFPKVILEQPKKLVNTYDSFDFDVDCHAVVNYNSGPGILAAVNGTRPIVDQSSLANAVSVTQQNIDQPYTVDRTQWLIEICHTEYTIEELKQGLWLKRLHPML